MAVIAYDTVVSANNGGWTGVDVVGGIVAFGRIERSYFVNGSIALGRKILIGIGTIFRGIGIIICNASIMNSE